MVSWKLVYVILLLLLFMVWKDRTSQEFFSPISRISPGQLGVASYNIQYLPYMRKDLAKLKPILLRYPIILLQECFNRLTTLPLAEIFPEYYICRGTLQGAALVNSGLVILSQYPIVDYEFTPFGAKNFFTADILSNKGFLSAEIQLPDKRIRVVNAHLQSSDYTEYDPIVKDQLAQIMSYTETLKVPYIIGGDFNIDYRELSYPNIYAPSEPTIYCNLKTAETSSTPKEGYRPFIFDYFFVKGLTPTKKVKTYTSSFSDHNPVFFLL